VTVPVGQAPAVTQASSAGAIAVALLPAGEKVPQTPKQPPAQQQPTSQPTNQPNATPRGRSTGTP
jgi:hypothetical protein